MRKYYSIYEVGTDRPIIIHGTVEECSAVLKIKPLSFHRQLYRQRHGCVMAKYEIFEDDNISEEELS